MKILIGGRKHIYGLISSLSSDQLLKFPEGYKTNILWNIGHLVATQQVLHYSLSGIAPRVSEEFLQRFRKGSSPLAWEDVPDFAEVVGLFLELPAMMQEDYEKGLFSDFKTYTTSAGIVLENIDDAMVFNNFHEGIHTGIIQCLLKVI